MRSGEGEHWKKNKDIPCTETSEHQLMSTLFATTCDKTNNNNKYEQ